MQLTINIPRHLDVFSDDELYAFCLANPELRIERDETGHIIIMPPPTGFEGSYRNMNLGGSVWNWNATCKKGKVTDSNGGYTLPDTSMRAPDVAWTSNERLATVPAESLKRFAPVCPDFIIELRSESDNLRALQEKMHKWIKNGVRLGWLVDPSGQTTTIYRPGLAPETRPFTDTLSGEDVLSGFTLNVAQVLDL